MILALDVETSGLVPRGVEIGDAQFPWPTQIGAVLFRDDGTDRALFSSLVRADGRKITAGASNVHGITNRQAATEGVSQIAAMAVVCGFAAQAKYLIGFNAGFDRSICESALIRLGKDTRMLCRPGLEVIDLMTSATALCKIPSEHETGGFRWPSLDVACQTILGDPPREGPHDALQDATRAKRLFLALRDLGMIEVAA